MNRLVFPITLLLLAAVIYTYAQEIAVRCGPNQVYTTCLRPCHKTCSDPYGLEGDCVGRRCECIEGYVFQDGVCIPKEKCSGNPCPGNRTYQIENINVITCDNIFINPKDPGCYCKPGYLLNRDTGECVLPDDCPKELHCYKNEVEDDCVTPCPATCLDPRPPICYFLVCNRGCSCKPPFIRDTATGKCVLPKDCPDPCPENEVYLECGTACEPNCESKFGFCTDQCVSGCFCAPGYVRECSAKGSKCIPKEDCK